jgi:hypothetical protein
LADNQNRVNSILTNSFDGTIRKYALGEPCNAFDWVYLAYNGVRKAIANSETTMPIIGICVESAISGEISILEDGEVINTAWDLSTENKGIVYGNQHIAGGFHQDLNSFAEDDILQILGYAKSSKKMRVRIDLTYVTVGDG